MRGRPAARQTLPYGSWPSPLSVEKAVASGRALRESQFDGSQPFWIEGRPEEGGRSVIMSLNADGKAVDVTPVGYDARTRVHEYGGGAYAVSRGLVVFANFADGRLYRHTVGDEPDPLTEDRPLRYAALHIDSRRARVLCVVEDHSPDDEEPRNTIGAVSLANGSLTELVSGADFFSDPRLDPAGDRLAWLCWSRPNMPWDGTELWVGALSADGLIADAVRMAGGPDESIVQPTWAPDGSLLFASDRNGWWNLYRWRGEDGQVLALAPMQAEFAEPQWVFGQTQFAPLADGRVAAIANADGQDRLLVLRDGEAPVSLDLPYTQLSYLCAAGTSVAVVAGSPAEPTAVVQLDVDVAAPTTLRTSGEPPIGPEWISMPQSMEFPTTGGLTAHALLYEPVNPHVSGPADERPPLVVLSHGGPTAQASSRFDAGIQFFTTRGFAVVDVDYGGSTGYGRAYRERLNGQWGIVDLEDCVNAARWLAWRGTVDGARMAIRGGSAGGYTTLCALCFTDVFACGASYFGVGDLEALARFTHKFESRYLDRMVAPYPAEVELYRRRSPIHHIDRVQVPVLVLQGADDMVVPQAQADHLVETLAGNDVPYAYLLFQGEGHGFRRSENIRRSLEAELSFYGQVFGFAPADELPPLEVHGLADDDANHSTQRRWAARSTALPE
jgi:dipeptidyl aminopeptidase/acylaminoacyl peptidase